MLFELGRSGRRCVWILPLHSRCWPLGCGVGHGFSGRIASPTGRARSVYQALDHAAKARFEQRMQLFLADAQTTGVQTEVNGLTRLLVAAAAVTPTC
ncbi:MAG: zinc-dependent peptidase [Janthinobacterium lividum]